MKYLVQMVKDDPKFMRKHWHEVDAKDCHGAIISLLKRNPNAVPRMARMSGGTVYVTVAPTVVGKTSNIRDNGVPFLVHGFTVGLK